MICIHSLSFSTARAKTTSLSIASFRSRGGKSAQVDTPTHTPAPISPIFFSLYSLFPPSFDQVHGRHLLVTYIHLRGVVQYSKNRSWVVGCVASNLVVELVALGAVQMRGGFLSSAIKLQPQPLPLHASLLLSRVHTLGPVPTPPQLCDSATPCPTPPVTKPLMAQT